MVAKSMSKWFVAGMKCGLNGEKQNGCFRLLGNKLLHMFSKKLYNT
jgi:hypothetical protein